MLLPHSSPHVLPDVLLLRLFVLVPDLVLHPLFLPSHSLEAVPPSAREATEQLPTFAERNLDALVAPDQVRVEMLAGTVEVARLKLTLRR